ncbi:hypothetical protein EON81_06225 [bacterium]|nr:MAG: hypothetical protein EON81_06225 [bacterium]
MIPPAAPPKLFLLTAKEAPVCIVLAKVRKETWHVLRWDLKAGTLQHGSWFVGELDVSATDVSWDGEYMVYAATNFSRTPPENGWIGLCRPPVLTTQVHANVGWYCWGGGLFTARDELYWENIRDHPLLTQEVVPFQFKHFPRWDADLPSPHRINYEWFMAWRRMRRDGWLKVPESPSHEWRFPHRKVKLTLSAYVGRGTGTFAYQLLERPELFSPQTTEAT